MAKKGKRGDRTKDKSDSSSKETADAVDLSQVGQPVEADAQRGSQDLPEPKPPTHARPEDRAPELNKDLTPGGVRQDLAPGVDGVVGDLHAFDRAALAEQVGGLTNMNQGLEIGKQHGAGADDMLDLAGKHGLKPGGKAQFGLPDRHTDDNAPPTGKKDWYAGEDGGVEPTQAQIDAAMARMNATLERAREQIRATQLPDGGYPKVTIEPVAGRKGMTDPDSDQGGGGVSGIGTDGTFVNKGDWVSKTVNPDLGGGDSGGGGTIDPGKIEIRGIDPGVVDKHPDYEETTVVAGQPPVKSGDWVSKPVNPTDVDPGRLPGGPPPSGGGGGGGDPQARGAPEGEIAEAAPNQVAPPAPPPVVAQEAPEIAVGPGDFTNQPVGVGAPAGEPGAPVPDDGGDPPD